MELKSFLDSPALVFPGRVGLPKTWRTSAVRHNSFTDEHNRGSVAML
jgi:hypothetical protein